MKNILAAVSTFLFLIPALSAGSNAKLITEKVGKYAVIKPADGLKLVGQQKEERKFSWKKKNNNSKSLNGTGFLYLDWYVYRGGDWNGGAFWAASGWLDRDVIANPDNVRFTFKIFLPASIPDNPADLFITESYTDPETGEVVDIASYDPAKFTRLAYSKQFMKHELELEYDAYSFRTPYEGIDGESILNNWDNSAKGFINGPVRLWAEIEDSVSGQSYGNTEGFIYSGASVFGNGIWPFYKAMSTIYNTAAAPKLRTDANATVDVIRFSPYAFTKLDSLGKFEQLPYAAYYYKNMSELRNFLNSNNIQYQISSFSTQENGELYSNLPLYDDEPVCYLVLTKFNGTLNIDGITYSKNIYSEYDHSFVLYELNAEDGTPVNESACWQPVPPTTDIIKGGNRKEEIIKALGKNLYKANAKLEAYDMIGSKVASAKNGELSLEGLSKAIYILKATTQDNRVETKKVIKK